MNPPAPPNRTRAMIPPTSDPARPRATVAYHGIGSGPGSAQRASPPTTKPQTMSRRMKSSNAPRKPPPRATRGRTVLRPAASPSELGHDRASPLPEEPADDGHEDDRDDDP